jgi:hypothetical protein
MVSQLMQDRHEAFAAAAEQLFVMSPITGNPANPRKAQGMLKSQARRDDFLKLCRSGYIFRQSLLPRQYPNTGTLTQRSKKLGVKDTDLVAVYNLVYS